MFVRIHQVVGFLFSAVLAALLVVGAGVAADGDRRTSFGTDGWVRLAPFPGYHRAMSIATQSDGRVVVAGDACPGNLDLFVARLTPDGALDPSFGGRGYRLLDTSQRGFQDGARAVLIQDDGNIVVAGDSLQEHLLARFLPDGGLDRSLGGTGYVRTSIAAGGWQRALAVAARPDGRLLSGGASGTYRAVITQHLPDGTLDASFGDGGIADLGDLLEPRSMVHGVALDAAGNILVVACSGCSSSACTWTALRLRPDGRHDPSFVAPAVISEGWASDDHFLPSASIALAANGKVLVGVPSHLAGLSDGAAVVARLLPDGQLDPAFGTGGRARLEAADGSHIEMRSLTLDALGRPLLGGASWRAGYTRWLAARFLVDGSLDETFGDAGVAVHEPPRWNEVGASGWLTCQGSGLFITGWTHPNIPLPAVGELLVLELEADGCSVPECDAGTDIVADCSPVQLEGAVVGGDSPDVELRWTSDCGARFLPSDEVLEPVVTFGDSCDVDCTLTLTVTRPGDETCEDERRVLIVDTIPPRILAADEMPLIRWSPNHAWFEVRPESISPVLFDNCTPAPSLILMDCISDQQVDGLGDGHFAPDCVADERGVRVRVERSGLLREGRNYTLIGVARDSCGNQSEPAPVGTVHVPHDRRE